MKKSCIMFATLLCSTVLFSTQLRAAGSEELTPPAPLEWFIKHYSQVEKTTAQDLIQEIEASSLYHSSQDILWKIIDDAYFGKYLLASELEREIGYTSAPPSAQQIARAKALIPQAVKVYEHNLAELVKAFNQDDKAKTILAGSVEQRITDLYRQIALWRNLFTAGKTSMPVTQEMFEAGLRYFQFISEYILPNHEDLPQPMKEWRKYIIHALSTKDYSPRDLFFHDPEKVSAGLTKMRDELSEIKAKYETPALDPNPNFIIGRLTDLLHDYDQLPFFYLSPRQQDEYADIGKQIMQKLDSYWNHVLADQTRTETVARELIENEDVGLRVLIKSTNEYFVHRLLRQLHQFAQRLRWSESKKQGYIKQIEQAYQRRIEDIKRKNVERKARGESEYALPAPINFARYKALTAENVIRVLDESMTVPNTLPKETARLLNAPIVDDGPDSASGGAGGDGNGTGKKDKGGSNDKKGFFGEVTPIKAVAGVSLVVAAAFITRWGYKKYLAWRRQRAEKLAAQHAAHKPKPITEKPTPEAPQVVDEWGYEITW